ncbi:rhodanese [Guyparkeria hydrothermalis]|uniref:rhodanese-like domain-containing protein n=1 Tax=Guyparkeria hydrothermalis TaxID=923 RepID=UPI00202274CA|nr:rhodanese-like domain-containing protein [Guyparkeria hydrothermalis]MCL7745371.1 rhodanese [Guyparkeria hydrothermalis]
MAYTGMEGRNVRRRKRAMTGRLIGTAMLAATLAWLSPSAWATEDFPLREKYESVGLQPIETAELAETLDSVTVVDARSTYEYETLHIKDARSVPLASASFNATVKSLAEASGQPLVFYCNGVTCSVSYKAAIKAREAGLSRVRVYDAGVFAWAKAHPEHTTLLGAPLESADRLIADEQFQSHLLPEDDFYGRIVASTDPLIVDIRSQEQRQGVSLFQMRDRHVPLTTGNRELNGLVQTAMREGRPMFFLDATGKQVRWLQYYLEAQGAEDYWFLEGGARTLYESMGLK